jgi:hypothetical protein
MDRRSRCSGRRLSHAGILGRRLLDPSVIVSEGYRSEGSRTVLRAPTSVRQSAKINWSLKPRSKTWATAASITPRARSSARSCRSCSPASASASRTAPATPPLALLPPSRAEEAVTIEVNQVIRNVGKPHFGFPCDASGVSLEFGHIREGAHKDHSCGASR